jgi:hypothetical protein
MIPEIILTGAQIINLHEDVIAMTLDARLMGDLIGIKYDRKQFVIEQGVTCLFWPRAFRALFNAIEGNFRPRPAR